MKVFLTVMVNLWQQTWTFGGAEGFPGRRKVERAAIVTQIAFPMCHFLTIHKDPAVFVALQPSTTSSALRSVATLFLVLSRNCKFELRLGTD